MDLKIRDMTRQDVPNVCDIQIEAFGERTPNDFDHCIESDIYWYGVAELSGSIVAYFGTMIIGEECEVLTLAVDRLYRGRGIGKYVLAGVIAHAKRRGCKKIYLEVDENNTIAVSLYKKLGFKPRYVRKGYYEKAKGGKADAIVMQLEL